jgi:hypothetical protein
LQPDNLVEFEVVMFQENQCSTKRGLLKLLISEASRGCPGKQAVDTWVHKNRVVQEQRIVRGSTIELTSLFENKNKLKGKTL